MNWISVNDRLPIGAIAKDGVISELIIAYTIDEEVCTGWIESGGQGWYLMTYDNDYHSYHKFGYVTHWMPLPKPPKEKV